MTGASGRRDAAALCGEDLAKQELDAILAAEREAAEAIEAARIQARELLAQADAKAAEILKVAREEAHRQADEIKRRASEVAKSVEREAEVQAASEIERIKNLAGPRMDEAVKAVIQRIKESM